MKSSACKFLCGIVGLAAVFAAWGVERAPHTGTLQSSFLYTEPDPSAGGGIRGNVEGAVGPVLGVFAMPTDNPRAVYKAEIRSGREFEFRGLPSARYDLLILLEAEFHEGLTLCRDESNLTEKDERSIRERLTVSEPFFDLRALHRLAGVTGTAGSARALVQWVRTRPITDQAARVWHDIQVRTIRLAMLEDVGPGWQLLRTREFVRQEVAPGMTTGLIRHYYNSQLSGIRVVDSIKDLGAIRLR